MCVPVKQVKPVSSSDLLALLALLVLALLALLEELLRFVACGDVEILRSCVSICTFVPVKQEKLSTQIRCLRRCQDTPGLLEGGICTLVPVSKYFSTTNLPQIRCLRRCRGTPRPP